jgi:GNAT superfamily N-acetyltransferase
MVMVDASWKRRFSVDRKTGETGVNHDEAAVLVGALLATVAFLLAGAAVWYGGDAGRVGDRVSGHRWILRRRDANVKRAEMGQRNSKSALKGEVDMERWKTTIDHRVVTVRQAESGDEWAIRRLFAQLHAFNASLEERFALADGWKRVLTDDLNRERDAGRGVTLLAWDGADPVGLAMMSGHADSPLFRHRSWAELTALHVAPPARGRGVADLLLAAGCAWAEQRGYTEVRLYVTSANERARRFYARSGFRPIQEIWTADLDGGGTDHAACSGGAMAQTTMLTATVPVPPLGSGFVAPADRFAQRAWHAAGARTDNSVASNLLRLLGCGAVVVAVVPWIFLRDQEKPLGQTRVPRRGRPA